jgi:hypothetical protein
LGGDGIQRNSRRTWEEFGIGEKGSLVEISRVRKQPSSKDQQAMRLKSGVWVSAYVRRCNVEGAFAVVRRRGAEDAGAIFIKVSRLDGTADVYGPAPQAAFDDGPIDRAFSPALKSMPAPEADAEAYLARQVRFDPDMWIVETEDRAGRHFLDRIVK